MVNNMRHKERIGADDRLVDILLKMTDGNPGALTVLLQTVDHGAAIDPDSAFKELGGCIALDTLGVYGSKIWILYKDICGESTAKMLGILRAYQLGFVSYDALHAAVNAPRFTSNMLDVEDLLVKVRERLPNGKF